MKDVVEQLTIRPIPESRRHGGARGLFPFWFTANSSAFTIVLGAIGIELGLGLVPAVLAIVAGAAVGGLFMAAHSAQGPRLGLAQLVQSRAQFGFAGALLPNILIWLVFLGYIVGENVLAAQALSGLWHITYAEAMAAACFATWLVVFFGYRIMHGVNRVVAVIALILFVVLLVRLLQRASGTLVDLTSFRSGTWLLFFSINVAGQVGWSPYVCDYSRYLPSGTSARQAFWSTYAGSVSSAVLFAGLGAAAGSVALRSLEVNSVGYLSGLLPGAGWLVIVALLLSVVAGNAINLYSPLLSGAAIVSRDGGPAPGPVVRGAGTAVIMAVTGYVSAVVAASIITDVSDLSAFLLYAVIPWSAINLVDYYRIRRGRYDVPAIFRARGRYGAFNWRAVAVFVAGVAAEVPFMNASYPSFQGPASVALGGADISWLVGFVITAALYWLAAPRTTDPRDAVTGPAGLTAAD